MDEIGRNNLVSGVDGITDIKKIESKNLIHVQHADNVLSQRDLAELRNYIFKNMNFADETKFRRIPRKDGNDFPIYNFLPRDKEPTNLLEKYIVGLTHNPEYPNGRQYHIEYWIRYNDALEWHLDGDEVIERSANAIQKPVRFPSNTFCFYVHVENLRGGEMEVCLFEQNVLGYRIIDNYFEPPQGSTVMTVKPKSNYLIKFLRPLYHRVNKVQTGQRLALLWSQWHDYPYGFEKGNHWNPSEIEPVDESTGFLVKNVEWPIKENI